MKEKTPTNNRDYTVGFGVGLLAGVIIGGVIALLYAPRSGKETRQLIKDKVTEMMEVVKDIASEASQK